MRSHFAVSQGQENFVLGAKSAIQSFSIVCVDVSTRLL